MQPLTHGYKLQQQLQVGVLYIEHEVMLFKVWLNPQIVLISATIANKTNDPPNLQRIQGNDSYEHLHDHRHRQQIYPGRQMLGTNGHPNA